MSNHQLRIQLKYISKLFLFGLVVAASFIIGSRYALAANEPAGDCRCSVLKINTSAQDGGIGYTNSEQNFTSVTEGVCKTNEQNLNTSCGEKCQQAASCTFTPNNGRCGCSYEVEVTAYSKEYKWYEQDGVNVNDCKESAMLDAIKAVAAGKHVYSARCVFSKLVDYCCCRAGTDCTKKNGPEDKRYCSVEDFESEAKLDDSQYTVTKIPASGSCSDANNAKTVDYCCCRAGEKCVEKNGNSIDRKCSVMDFPNEQKLPDSSYAVTEKKPDGTCPTKTAVPGKSSPSGAALTATLEKYQSEAQKLNKVSYLNGVKGLIGRVISFFLFIIGSFSFVLYLYAGVLWMTAAGNSEQTQQAKNIFLWTSLGLVALFGSYVVISQVIQFVQAGGTI